VVVVVLEMVVGQLHGGVHLHVQCMQFVMMCVLVSQSISPILFMFIYIVHSKTALYKAAKPARYNYERTNKEEFMKLARLLPATTVYAHCDLPCGVYDPAQARIEAESVLAITKKMADNQDPDFRTRALILKEQRGELVKHHLWVLWTDYFKPEHLEKHPDLHDLFWRATKAAGQAKHSSDPADAQKSLDLIAEIDAVFKATKQK
jgi:nickel superoxide dismutase